MRENSISNFSPSLLFSPSYNQFSPPLSLPERRDDNANLARTIRHMGIALHRGTWWECVETYAAEWAARCVERSHLIVALREASNGWRITRIKWALRLSFKLNYTHFGSRWGVPNEPNDRRCLSGVFGAENLRWVSLGDDFSPLIAWK